MDVAKVAYACIITCMYFLSGFDKLLTPADEHRKLTERLSSIPWLRWASEPTLVTAGIVFAGLLEAVAPPLAVYGAASGEVMWRRLGRWAAWALAAFTVVVTLMFYFPPLEKRYFPFVSNLTSFGALLLLAHVI